MRLPGHIGRVAGSVLVFALAAVGGALIHRNLPASRRAIVARVNAALATAVPGRIQIEQLGFLGLDRVAGVSVGITDPDGVMVLHARDLAARIDLGTLLRTLRASGPLEIDLPVISSATLDVNLDPAPGGTLRIASAFVPATPAAAVPSPTTRGVHLQVRDVRLDRVTVRGSPLPALPLDVDLESVLVAAEVGPGTLVLDRMHADVIARGLPPGSITHGVLDAHFEQPSVRGGERAARLTWRGTVGAVPTTASALLEGNALYAVVDAPAVPPADLSALWPASPLTETASAHVEAVGLLPIVLLSARVTAGRGTLAAEGVAVTSGTRRASLRFTASSIDTRAVSAQAPQTSLDASGQVLFATSAAGAMGGVAVARLGGTAGPTVVPHTEIAADFAREAPPSGAMRGRARLVVREPGAPSTVDATVTPKGDALQVAFDASVVVPDSGSRAAARPAGQGQRAAFGPRQLRHRLAAARRERVGERPRRVGGAGVDGEPHASGPRDRAPDHAGSRRRHPRSRPRIWPACTSRTCRPPCTGPRRAPRSRYASAGPAPTFKPRRRWASWARARRCTICTSPPSTQARAPGSTPNGSRSRPGSSASTRRSSGASGRRCT